MINPYVYEQDSVHIKYDEAKKRKTKLKTEGFRTKLRKLEDGSFVIYKKNIAVIDTQGTKVFKAMRTDKYGNRIN